MTTAVVILNKKQRIVIVMEDDVVIDTLKATITTMAEECDRIVMKLTKAGIEYHKQVQDEEGSIYTTFTYEESDSYGEEV